MPIATQEAGNVFARTLVELGVAEHEKLDVERLGRRGALLAAAELLWEEQLGPSLTARQVGELLGVSRQAVNERTQRGTLLALRSHDGGLEYPAFQFGPDGQPLEGLAGAIKELSPLVQTPYTIAAWLTSREPELGDATPVGWLRSGRDPEVVAEQARREAARLAR